MHLLPVNSKLPKNPFMYHSAFKLTVYFNNNKSASKTIHSVETKTTIQQIQAAKISEISFDRRAGFQYCIDLIDSMANKVHNALLFDAYEENLKFAQFKSGKWFHSVEPHFEEKYIQISRQFSIYKNFVICSDVALNAAAYNINSPIHNRLK